MRSRGNPKRRSRRRSQNIIDIKLKEEDKGIFELFKYEDL